MAKFIIIGVLALLLIIGAVFIGIQSVILEDDFFTDEDFKILTPALNKDPSSYKGRFANDDIYEDDKWKLERQPDFGSGASAGLHVSNFNIQDGKLVLSARGNTEARAILKKSMKNRDILIQTEVFMGTSHILLSDKTIATLGSSSSDPQFFTVNLILDSINTDEYHVFVNGRETAKVKVTEGNFFLRFITKGSLYINKIASRPFFNCEVDTDEVGFTAKYAEGEKITFNNLPIQPVKFCPDSRTVILRDIETGDERADLFRTSFKTLASGDTFTVPEGQLVEINYIIDFVEGSPTSNCPSGQYVKDGQCKQYVTEQPDIIKIQNYTIPVLVSTGAIIFTDSVNVGDIVISSDKPQFVCETEQDTVRSPNPQSSCWRVKINGVEHFYGEKKKFNDFIELTYIGDAVWRRGEINQYTNTISLQLTDFSFLRAKAVNRKDPYVKLNEEHDIEFEIDNKLTEFNAGLSIVKQTDLLTGESSEIKYFTLEKGVKTYKIPTKETQLGEVSYTITPFVTIGDKNVFSDRAIVYNYIAYQGDKPQPINVNIEPPKTEPIKEPELPIVQPPIENKSWQIAFIALIGVIILSGILILVKIHN